MENSYLGEDAVLRGCASPASGDPVSSRMVRAEATVGGGGTMAASHILVVDDQPELLRLLGTYLPRHGYTVTCRSTGAEALAALKDAQTPYDLAILDLILPDIEGRELAIFILKSYPAMRVLIASGSFFQKAALGEEHSGRTAVLQKPYTPKSLVDAIDQLMQRPV